jgi:hypothetical protein
MTAVLTGCDASGERGWSEAEDDGSDSLFAEEEDDRRQRKTETGTSYASTNSPGRGLRALLEVRR